MIYSREILHNRHRLSHQQIDNWLGENNGNKFLKEKLFRLEAVKAFLDISDKLAKADIPFVNLKGPLLSYRIYNDPAVRTWQDVDILVEKGDLEPALNVAFENGFRFVSGEYWPEKPAQQELYLHGLHNLTLINPTTNLKLEIHWLLMHGLPVKSVKQEKIVNENTTVLVFAGRKFKVLTLEFELLYLLIHGSRHGWHRLKWLVDVKDFPMDKIDTQKFNALATDLLAHRIIGQTKQLIKHFFNQDLQLEGDRIIPTFFQKYPYHMLESEVKEQLSVNDLLKRFWYQMLMFKSFRYKLKVIAMFQFRRNDISAIDSKYKIVYYLYRPYSFIKRRILHAG